MGKINILGFEMANLIAAGEVVERPSSVLKELIENSIDSGATNIVAEIKRGGVALIRVSDNGCGMDKSDLPVAIKRHATSKIKEKEDLDSIMTLGFRGEALAAISSVSTMTIISKTKESEIGSMLTAEAGQVVDISDVSSADGTTVVVENLFYNVPARRKFLKKDSTEAMNVAALVEKVALSRPDISIQLLIDGEERFRTPGDSDLLNCIYSIYGKDFSEKLIYASGTSNGIKVHGYIGRSDNVKRNRNYQNVFINGRYVKSMTVMAAIEKAYTSYIAPECFPTCVLFLEMNPGVVDVNVHPAKLEVKFSDERVIFESVYYTLKSALETHEYRPELTLTGNNKHARNPIAAYVPIGEDTKGKQLSVKKEFYTPTPENPYQIKSAVERISTPKKDNDFSRPLLFGNGSIRQSSTPSMTPKESVELLDRYKKTLAVNEEAQASKSAQIKEKEEKKEYKIIGEAFDCYVMVEHEDSILIIDKHAAHERVIFEDLKRKQLASQKIASQSLMLPISVILSPEEISTAKEYYSEIHAVGFEYTINEKAADITEIPSAISICDAEGLFVELLDEISTGIGKPDVTIKTINEKALYQIACKAAIKGGRVYDKNIINWLVSELLRLPDITVCPHGRPVAYKLTKREMDKQFDRIK